MNLEDFPEDVKKDIEDQSLAILEIVKDEIIVIGGWAVRALAGDKHTRYTLDIDGISGKGDMLKLKKKLESVGLKSRDSEWGVQFYQRYEPKITIDDNQICKRVSEVELRIELSKPRIKEFQTHHYFEFSLTDYVTREIPFHNKDAVLTIKVPPAKGMAAVKLGLPVDYKNNFDSAVLLRICDIDEVIATIRKNDDWHEMVMRRIPKLKGRIKDPSRLENILLTNARINVRNHIKKLDYIEANLRK